MLFPQMKDHAVSTNKLYLYNLFELQFKHEFTRDVEKDSILFTMIVSWYERQMSSQKTNNA